jgi:hypothetical protein
LGVNPQRSFSSVNPAFPVHFFVQQPSGKITALILVKTLQLRVYSKKSIPASENKIMRSIYNKGMDRRQKVALERLP